MDISKGTVLKFGYRVEEVLWFEELYTQYSEHKRLQVFIQKGCKCVNCGVEGKHLIKAIDKGGGIHVDLYTDNLDLMTVDHIIPKSKKGKSHISNYQPMCYTCNQEKRDIL